MKGDLVINQPFLDAVAETMGASDPLDERIQQSIGHFLDANRLDDYNDARRDLVW